MTTRQRKKSILNQLVLPLLTIGFLAYFGFHTFHGDYGLIGYQAIQADISSKQDELVNLVKQRRRLENRVALLGSSSLDRETLEEFARAQLNVAHPNEVVILLKR